MKRIGTLAIVCILISLLASSAIGCGNSQTHKQGFKVNLNSGNPKVEAFIGYPVRMINGRGGDVMISVTDYHYGPTPSGFDPWLYDNIYRHKKFVIAHCKITNYSTTAAYFDPYGIAIYTMDKGFQGMGRSGYLTEKDSPQIAKVARPLLDTSRPLKPGQTEEGNVIFAVQPDIEFFALEFHMEGFELLRIKSGDSRRGEGGWVTS